MTVNSTLQPPAQMDTTLTLLALAVAQIESGLLDGEQSIRQLLQGFERMAVTTNQLQDVLSATADQPATELTTALQGEIQQAILAFQFYDRLTQRLDHVGKGLLQMRNLLSDAGKRTKSEQWLALQESIRSDYTMDDERLMFEHILAGASIEEALSIYRHHFSRNDGDDFGTNDDIELF